MKQVTKKRFASVWDAIEGTAEKAENLKLRSSLMITLKKHLVGTGLNRAQIAELFGVRQRRHSSIKYEAPLAFEASTKRLITVSTERG
jgi:predicted XRE-type DNA-binding protein